MNNHTEDAVAMVLAHFEKMQAVVADYLDPEGKTTNVDEIITFIDGPEQRAVQDAIAAACAKDTVADAERAMLLEALERNITNFKGQRADLDFARDAIAKVKGTQP